MTKIRNYVDLINFECDNTPQISIQEACASCRDEYERIRPTIDYSLATQNNLHSLPPMMGLVNNGYEMANHPFPE